VKDLEIGQPINSASVQKLPMLPKGFAVLCRQLAKEDIEREH